MVAPIKNKAKIDLYYMLLFWSTKEVVDAGVYFVNKDITLNIAKVCKKLAKQKQKQSDIVKRSTERLLKNITTLDVNMKTLSFEMMCYLAVDYLVNIVRDTTARLYFGHLPLLKILEGMREKYPVEMKEHYKFFTILEEQI